MCEDTVTFMRLCGISRSDEVPAGCPIECLHGFVGVKSDPQGSPCPAKYCVDCQEIRECHQHCLVGSGRCHARGNGERVTECPAADPTRTCVQGDGDFYIIDMSTVTHPTNTEQPAASRGGW